MSGICSKSFSEVISILFHRTPHWRCCTPAWRGLTGSVCSAMSLQRNLCYAYLTRLLSLERNAKNNFWAVVLPFSKCALQPMKLRRITIVSTVCGGGWKALTQLFESVCRHPYTFYSALSVAVKHSNWTLVCKALKTKPRPKHFSPASQKLFDSCCPTSTA